MLVRVAVARYVSRDERGNYNGVSSAFPSFINATTVE